MPKDTTEKTLFTRIIDRELPADIVYEDDQCICIRDINPKALTHVLLIPRKPIPTLAEATAEDKALLGHLLLKVGDVARLLGVEDGFRTVVHNGEKGGQEVFHLHLHLLANKTSSGTVPIELPLLIEPNDLANQLERPELLIVDLCSETNYLRGHIPGAVHVTPQELMSRQPPAIGKLPAITQLEQLFSRLGLSENKHVVVYDDEGGGWAGRFIWTLDVIGHRRYSYLNGGLYSWAGEKLPLETTVKQPVATDYKVTIDKSPIAEIEDILPNLSDYNTVIWDARSPAEYRGDQVLAAKGGHIPGAVNCEWTQLMDPQKQFRIRTDAAEFLAKQGITSDNKIITHCQSHHRSGFTYLVGRVLGLSIRGYHGSWSEWGNHPDTPVER